MRRALISSKAAFTPTTNPHSRHCAPPNATVRATFVMTDGARLTPTGRECWIAARGPLVTWTMTTVTGLGDSATTLLLSPLPSFALRHGLSRRGGCHRPPDEFRVINNFQRQRFLCAGHHWMHRGSHSIQTDGDSDILERGDEIPSKILIMKRYLSYLIQEWNGVQ